METERIAWHSFPLGDVFAHLGSKRDGLSENEAKMRIEHFGRNDFLERNNIIFSRMFLSVFFNPFFGIAVFSAFASILAKMYFESAVIFSLSFLGFVILFFQKIGIEKNMWKVKSLESKSVVVLRDGIKRRVLFSEIVPGDVIAFHSGDEIPADARIIQSFGLKIEEEKITGVHGSISKTVSTISAGIEIPSRTNTIYGGSFVSDGSGEAVVFETGHNLEIFKSAKSKAKDYFSETLLERKILKLGKFLLAVIFASSAGVLTFGFAIGKGFAESFAIISALSAFAVLPVLYIAGFSALACGVGKILKAKCIVKSFAVVEKIGNTDVIISEKPGIFAFGESNIAKILTPERRNGILELSLVCKYTSNHLLALTYGVFAYESYELSECMATKGNMIDDAFTRAAVSAGIDIRELDSKFKKIGSMPQSGSRNFSISFRETHNGERWAFIAGYADALIQNVKKIQILNKYENAVSFEIGMIKEYMDSMAKSGLTVLAVCSKKIEKKENLSDWASASGDFKAFLDLNLVGLVGIKHSVIENLQLLLSESRMAGIRAVLVTGDHTMSAKSFGIETGIVQKNIVPEILEGKEIEAFDAKELLYRIRNVDILSRASFDQKLKITKAWMENKKCVCVFGDSPDDAEILRESDIGISLSNAADSVKNASGIVILDGGLKSFLEAVSRGRVILSNIKKVFVYVLGLSLSEALLIGAGVIFGFNMPVIATQILWVNIAVGIFPALALSRKEAEKGIMNLPPPAEKKKFMGNYALFTAIAAGLINSAALFGVFMFFKSSFNSVAYARSVTFAALCVNSLFIAFSAAILQKPVWESSFAENRKTIMFLGLGILVSASAFFISPFRTALDSNPADFLEWIIILGAGTLAFLSVEIVKWILIKKSVFSGV